MGLSKRNRHASSISLNPCLAGLSEEPDQHCPKHGLLLSHSLQRLLRSTKSIHEIAENHLPRFAQALSELS